MLFGDKIKQLRLNAKLTQEELALKLGITKRTLINYETGKCYPKQTEIYSKMAVFFNVTVDYLMSEQDTFIQKASEYGARSKKQAQDLINEFSGLFAGGSLSEEDKDAVVKAIMDAYWETKEINKKYSSRKK